MERFRWSARVRNTGKGRAHAYVRDHRFEVGLAVQFDQEYRRVTALEYALGALGADIVNTIDIEARRRRVHLDNIEAVVDSELNNPLTHLGVVGEEGHPGIEKLMVRVYVNTPEAEEDIRRIWQQALEKSPLVRTLRAAVELELSLDVAV